MKAFLAASLLFASLSARAQMLALGDYNAMDDKNWVSCTEETVHSAFAAYNKMFVVFKKSCEEKDGEIADKVTSAIIEGDPKTYHVDCQEEQNRLSDWSDRLLKMKETHTCPAVCVHCALALQEELAKEIDPEILNREIEAEKAKAAACTKEEAREHGVDQCVAGLLSSLSPTTSLVTGQSNCVIETLHGAAKDVYDNIDGIWELAKMANQHKAQVLPVLAAPQVAISNWAAKKAVDYGSSWALSRLGLDALQKKSQTASGESDSFMARFSACKSCFVKQMAVDLFNAANQSIEENFGCEAWDSGTPHVGKCIKPMRSWKCASCAQMQNAFCGMAGYVGGEAVFAYLTGGTAAAAEIFAKVGGKAAAEILVHLPRTASALREAAVVAKSAQEGLLAAQATAFARYEAAMQTRVGRSIRKVTGAVSRNAVAKGLVYLPKEFGKIQEAALKCGYMNVSKTGERAANLLNKQRQSQKFLRETPPPLPDEVPPPLPDRQRDH